MTILKTPFIDGLSHRGFCGDWGEKAVVGRRCGNVGRNCG